VGALPGTYRVEEIPAGSLASVAERLERGDLRLAREGEFFPPRAALARIGCESWKDVLRVELDGKVAWVGRPRFSYDDPLVVDGDGRVVRVKKLREAAERALREKTYGGSP
jgi:hypothetical protein